MKKHKHIRPHHLIFIAATLLNVALLFFYYSPEAKALIGDEHTYVTSALQIINNQPFIRVPIWPPGYDYLLALTIYAGRILTFTKVLLFPQIIQIILWFIGEIFYWKITSHLLKTYQQKILCLSIYLFNPTLIAYSHFFWPEIPHLTIYLIALWIIICRSSSNNLNKIVGILFAAATLLKLVYLPISIVLMVFIFLKRYFHRKDLAPAIISIILFIVTISPTLLYNLKMHNRLMIADSSTINLWIGLNDKSLTDWDNDAIAGHEIITNLESAKTHNQRNTIYEKKISKLIKNRGLWEALLNQLSKQYFRLLDHRTFFTKQLPQGMKKRYFFSSTILVKVLRGWNSIIWGIILSGFGIGLCIIASKKSHFGIYLFTGIIAYNTSVFLFLHVKTRYVIQFLPMITIISSIGLFELWASYRNYHPIVENEYGPLKLRTIIIGSSLSCLLLFLAFHDLWS